MVQTGKILRFDDVRGYGFIVPDGGGEDVFVHANDLLDEKPVFSSGTSVEFEVKQGDRGLKAFAVRVKEGRPKEGERVSPPLTAVTAATAKNAIHEMDGLCDVLSQEEFVQELTELILGEVPELTGAQLTVLRSEFLGFAQKYGWVEG